MDEKDNFFHSLAFHNESTSSLLSSKVEKELRRFYDFYLKKRSNGFLKLEFPYQGINNSTNQVKVIFGFQFKKNTSKDSILVFFLNKKQIKTLNQEKLRQFFLKKDYETSLGLLKRRFACFSPLEGIFLMPIAIKKLWGKEVWFSGIEARGVSLARSHFSTKTHEIDEVLFVFRLFRFLNKNYIKNQQPILLKILKPLADKIQGQLYYELHEKKKEVYIISRISKKLYPQGLGKIRLGFNPEKKKNYDNAKLFFSAKLKAILSYKKIRFQIDKKIDDWKAKNKSPINQRGSLRAANQWSKCLSEEEVALEKKLRKEMESFSDYKSLKVGDTITIENKTPHALQAGVEAVEFQTPHYERLIISYPQKVLTQKDWDTEKAFQIMKKKTTLKKNLTVKDNAEILLEKCVSFKEFKVYKVAFKKIKTYNLMKFLEMENKEMIFFNLNAKIQIFINQLPYSLGPESAYLFPIPLVNEPKIVIKNLSSTPSFCLMAF